jgi:two-component system, NtrC family, sensor histidine kinase HydH
MGRYRFEVPLVVQIGAVVVLFAAALGTLWYTSSKVVEREDRRARANDRLKEASDQLEARGKDALASVRQFPDLMEPGDWSALDRELSDEVGRICGRYPGVEGGYYVPSRREQPFLPALPNESRKIDAPEGARLSVPPPSPPLPQRNLYDYVDTQVDAAYRKRNELSVVEDIPPYTIAIRTAPVRVNGRVVAATWTMTRLVDPIYLDQSARGYRWFAGLALAGIALSLVLTVRLARTVRRQAAERERLRTELRRSERLAALGKLLAGVAHEVRNPLAGIRGITQLWRRGLGLGDEGFDHLIDEVDRLESIVSRLLQFSRADAQDLTPGDLNAVAAEAARLAEDRAREQEIRVELDLEPDLPPVEMAPPALVQVLRNLTTNALQVMPRGGVLRLQTRLDPARGAVSASVADDGPGLSAEVLTHLFEPFFTTKAEGTGLGLAIAREIALAHRGDLRAENSPGGGAVFTLTLPVAKVPAAGGERP